MSEWLTRSFQEHSVLWLLVSSILGGIIGASLRFLFDVLLPQRLKDRRDIILAKRKYSTPILLAADELRKRTNNIIRFIDLVEKENWLLPDKEDHYYYWSTLYTVAQFMGWRQILRRTVVYLDFTTITETRRFENFLAAIQRGFTQPDLLHNPTSGTPALTEDKWTYTFWIQAIGDSMIILENGEFRIKGYAAFSNCLVKPDHGDFNRWVDDLGSLFRNLKAGEPRFRRIVAIHCILNAFINAVDPSHLRTEEQSHYWHLLSDEEANHVKTQICAITEKVSLT